MTMSERRLGMFADQNGIQCGGSFELRQPFSQPVAVNGFEVYRDNTGAHRSRVNCPVARENRGACLGGLPCVVVDFAPREKDVLTLRGYVLNVPNSTVSYNGNEVNLSETHTSILQVLMRNPGRVLSRETIFKARPSSSRSISTDVVSGEIAQLRRKLFRISESEESVIQTVSGEGWRFGPPKDALTAEGYSLASRTVSYGEGEGAELTRTEAALLRAFMTHPGEVLSKETLLEARPGKSSDPFILLSEVARLRRKLLGLPGVEENVIHAVSGEGWRFGQPREEDILEAEGYRLSGRSLAYGGESLDLTRTETALVKLLMSSPGKVISRGQLHEARPSTKSRNPKVVDSELTIIRRKLDQLPGPGSHVIEVVRGRGYKFEKPNAQ